MYSASWLAASSGSSDSFSTQRGSSAPSRTSPIAPDSSRVRAGASPNQKGSVGGAPWASAMSVLPSQLLSRPSQTSVAPGLTEASRSLQSSPPQPRFS